MPRSMWSGSLSFGLVNVPVALVSATRDLDVHFNQLHKDTGERLHVERVCKQEDKPVEYDELAKGYPREDGEGFVLLTEDELAAAQPEKTRTIDIDEFVDVADIDPIYFDHPYFLVPNADNEGALRAYRLLTGVMEQAGRAAIGRVVMRTKEYLVAIRVRDGLLSLVTLRFADEIRTADGLNLPGKKDQPSKEELSHAVSLVEELGADWDPARYEDRHRERLLAVVEQKRKGKTIKAPAEPEVPKAVPDLMAALRESLEAAKGPDGDAASSKSSSGGKSGAKSGGGKGAKGGKAKAKA